MDNPYPWLQDFVNQVPDLLQPVLVALAAAIPYFEGEGASVLGIVAGLNPVVAAIAAIAGNFLCVLLVVLLGARIRGSIVARRATGSASAAAVPTGGTTTGGADGAETASTVTATSTDADADAEDETTRGGKGRTKLRRWLVRFGVPGASLLAPLALPTMLTAAFFVAAGVGKERVLFWQFIAIVLWTGASALVASGVLALLGW
nr:small multidrug efflux protein [Microbacterium hydrocarbonoxydans]